MRADPRPFDRVAITLTHRPELIIDPHRPHVVVPLQFLEPQRWMVQIFREQLIRLSSRKLDPRIERCIRTPEAGPRERDHSRSMSIGSEPSALDCFKNASSF